MHASSVRARLTQFTCTRTRAHSHADLRCSNMRAMLRMSSNVMVYTDRGHRCLPVFDDRFYRDAGVHQLCCGMRASWASNSQCKRKHLCSMQFALARAKKTSEHGHAHKCTRTRALTRVCCNLIGASAHVGIYQASAHTRKCTHASARAIVLEFSWCLHERLLHLLAGLLAFRHSLLIDLHAHT